MENFCSVQINRNIISKTNNPIFVPTGVFLVNLGHYDSLVYTHCNAGALATGGYGTALGVIRSAWKNGSLRGVIAGETRPWLQGARLTSWELMQDDIPVTLAIEGAAAQLRRERRPSWVIVGADRVAANGDVANKIGTYLKALAAYDNGVPFYVALPSSTFDWETRNGVNDIPIEQRNGEEVSRMGGAPDAEMSLEPEIEVTVVAKGSPVANYAFDVTPARLVTGLITERGVCPATESGIRALFPEK